MLTQCLFADDHVLIATPRSGVERALVEYQKTSTDFDLTMSNPKTKHMVVCRLVEEGDMDPIVVKEERYLLWRSLPT